MNKKSTVAIIGTNGLPAKYGGFETLTNYLVEYLGDEFDVHVYCSKTPKKKRIKEYRNVKLRYFPFRANGWQSIIYDFVTIVDAYFRYKNLIILGFSGAFAFPLNVFFRKNIIFNIGGIEWKKVRGSKWTTSFEIFLKKIMERLSVRNSNTVIIDNLAFEDYLISNYNIKPILAEYGGDHASIEAVNKDLIKEYSFLERPYDLSVSRAQEDMNIHIVIDAYKQIPERTIVIISNWSISDYGINLLKKNHGIYSNIILLQSIYQLQTLNAIRANCQLYVHSHSLCGTAPSLVEAMSLNVPVIAFDVETNRFTTEERTLYFSDVKSLVDLLKNIDNKSLVKIRSAMFEIANRRYKWKRIADIYRQQIVN